MNEQKNTVSRRFFINGALVCSAACLLNPTIAFADEASTQQAEADAALAKLESMQSELDRASNDYYQALDEQQRAQEAMASAQRQIDQATATIASCQSELGTRARSMYRSGSNSFLDVLLGSMTFEDFATNWDILNTMNENDAALVQTSKNAREQMSESKAVYQVQEATAAQKASDAKQVQESAMATVADMQAVYNKLSAEAAALVAQKEAAQKTVADPDTLASLAEQGADAVADYGGSAGSGSASSGGGSADAGSGASSGATVDTGGSTPVDTGSGSVDTGGSGGSGAVDAGGSSGGGSSVVEDPAPSGSDLGSRVVSVALQYLGWDYVWGGKSPAYGGFDCSGFVSYCYSVAGGYAPSWTGSLINWGYQVWDPQPGDVCVIHNDEHQHTGIYYGGGQMIHASTFGVGVIIGRVQSGMQYRRSY